MSRDWHEKDHPRNPRSGEFVEKRGGGIAAWAGRISDAIGRRRGEHAQPGPDLGRYSDDDDSGLDALTPQQDERRRALQRRLEGAEGLSGPESREHAALQARHAAAGVDTTRTSDPAYLEEHDPLGAPSDSHFDSLPDAGPGHDPGDKEISHEDLARNIAEYGNGDYEIYDATGLAEHEWDTIESIDLDGAGRGGVDAGFVYTKGGGFHIAATPDDDADEEEWQSYEEDPNATLIIRRKRSGPADEEADWHDAAVSSMPVRARRIMEGLPVGSSPGSRKISPAYFTAYTGGTGALRDEIEVRDPTNGDWFVVHSAGGRAGMENSQYVFVTGSLSGGGGFSAREEIRLRTNGGDFEIRPIRR